MHPLRRFWLRLQGHDCYTCQHSQVFRSNGDGQVSRLHSFCRHPHALHADRPIPQSLWCDWWQRADDPDKKRPSELDETGLTA
ncbi:MAG: hypothetical protein GXP37_04580 [Chloroflexi bacterium]|nr:hypothetical protein [Chloroflexota bacterium]